MKTALLLLLLTGCTYEVSDMGNYREDIQHGWGATKKLFNSGRAPGNGFSVQSGTVLIEPATYTVSFRVGDLKAPNGGPNTGYPGFSPYAEIFWSLGGVDTRRVVSVVNGSTVSGVCEKFKVIAYDDTTESFHGTGAYDVAIEVGRGVRPATAMPPIFVDPITKGIYNVAPSSNVVVAVPQDIGASTVMITVFPLATGAVFGPQDVGVVQNALLPNDKVYDPRLYGFVPLEPGAFELTLVNAQPVIGGSNAIFSVTWGIDG